MSDIEEISPQYANSNSEIKAQQMKIRKMIILYFIVFLRTSEKTRFIHI